MPKEDVTIEKISDEKDAAPQPEVSKTPETPPVESAPAEPAPVAKAPEPEPAEPETVNKSESKPEDLKKQGGMAHLDLVWSLLDRMIGFGGEPAALAVQAKSLLKWTLSDATIHVPSLVPVSADSLPKGLSKEDVESKISSEVKKQLESALKNIPTMRKGLIQPETEQDDIRKKFEGLPPDKKLKVVLALQGQSA